MFKSDILESIETILKQPVKYGLNSSDIKMFKKWKEAIKKLLKPGFYELNSEFDWGDQSLSLNLLFEKRKVWVCCDLDGGIESAESFKTKKFNQKSKENDKYWVSSRDSRKIWFRERVYI